VAFCKYDVSAQFLKSYLVSVMGGGCFPGTIPQALGAASVLLASVNVAGGFVITKRMLDMFKREFIGRSNIRNLTVVQVPLILLNIHGCTASLLLSSQVVFSLLQALVWVASFKRVT
jgi:hypothetical protein